MIPSGWWTTQGAPLLKRLARAAGRADGVRRTLFIRHLDDHPEVLLASVVTDAKARGLDNVCVFFSHVAEPELLRLALTHAPVSGVGTKDCFPGTALPEELRDDPRVGRYWEPGGWCIPASATHIYFVGPWRLLTWAMLLETTRSGTASLRCRVATSWAPIPLSLIRAGRDLARASGLAALPRRARAAIQLTADARRIVACMRREAAVVTATLFIRHLDNVPEILVASALDDAKSRGLERITLFFSHLAESGMLREVLKKDGIASTGVKDAVVDSLLPADLAADRRVGRYWEPGGWILPEPAEHVYFVGPWRLITSDMLREALRRDVSTLRVRVATS